MNGMNDNKHLPLCIGYFGKPTDPNNCHICGWSELCRRVVAKERLVSLAAAVKAAKNILKGLEG